MRFGGEVVLVYPLIDVAKHHGEGWAENLHMVGTLDFHELAVCIARGGSPGNFGGNHAILSSASDKNWTSHCPIVDPRCSNGIQEVKPQFPIRATGFTA